MAGIRWLIRYVIDQASKDSVEADARRGAKKAEGAHDDAARGAGRSWSQKLRDAFKGGEKEGEKSAGVIKRFFQSTAGQIGATFAGMFALRQVVSFSRDIVKLGADSAEVASKFSTTFGSAAGLVQTFVDKWGAIAGLNQNEAKDFIATTGSMVRGMGLSRDAAAEMSIKVAKLAGDLTSFNNVPIEQSARAVRSALVGETKSLKTLGISLLQTDVWNRALANTGKKAASELTQQEKATAALELITERAGPSIGDLERTQGSLVNTSRRVTAEWGNFKIALGLALTSTSKGPGVLAQMSNAIQALTGWVMANRKEIADWAGIVLTTAANAATRLVLVGKLIANSVSFISHSLTVLWRGYMQSIIDSLNGGIDFLNWFVEKSNKILHTSFNPLDRIADNDNLMKIRDAMDAASDDAESLRENIIGLVDSYKDAGKAARGAAHDISAVAPGGVPGGKTMTAAERKAAEKAALKAQIAAGEQAVRLATIRPSVTGSFIPAATRKAMMNPVIGGAIIQSDEDKSKAERWAQHQIDVLDSISDAATDAAGRIESVFESAFSNLQGNLSDLGGIASAAFRAIGSAAIGSVTDLASKKVKENLAAALEAAAYALGFLAHGNFASSGAAWSSAAQHGAAALAWGALAGGGAASVSALGGAGGSRASGVNSGAFRASQADTRPEIHLHLTVDGITPRNSVHQKLLADTLAQGERRTG